MLYVGGDFRDGEIIHTFIEAGMFGNFDALSVNIIPEDILGSVREKSEEKAFAGVGDEFGAASTRGANPNTTTKSSKICEIILLTSRDGEG